MEKKTTLCIATKRFIEHKVWTFEELSMYTPTAARYNSLTKNDTEKKHEILNWAETKQKKIPSIVSIHIQIVCIISYIY